MIHRVDPFNNGSCRESGDQNNSYSREVSNQDTTDVSCLLTYISQSMINDMNELSMSNQ